MAESERNSPRDNGNVAGMSEAKLAATAVGACFGMIAGLLIAGPNLRAWPWTASSVILAGAAAGGALGRLLQSIRASQAYWASQAYGEQGIGDPLLMNGYRADPGSHTHHHSHHCDSGHGGGGDSGGCDGGN